MFSNCDISIRFSRLLAFYYATLHAGFAIYMVFFPLWLKSRGVDDASIGYILSTVTFVRVVATPVIGRIADRHGSLSHVIRICSVAMACCFLLVYYAP